MCQNCHDSWTRFFHTYPFTKIILNEYQCLICGWSGKDYYKHKCTRCIVCRGNKRKNSVTCSDRCKKIVQRLGKTEIRDETREITGVDGGSEPVPEVVSIPGHYSLKGTIARPNRESWYLKVYA